MAPKAFRTLALEKYQILVKNLLSVASTVLYTYPIVICDINISFFVNKELHHLIVAFSSCHVQRSPLIEKKAIVHDLEIVYFQTHIYYWQYQKFQSLKTKRKILFSTDLLSIVYISYTYLITIFDIDISSLFNKIFDCVNMVSFNCQVQGSLLMESKKSLPAREFNVDLKIAPLEMRITQTLINSTNLSPVV